MATSASKAPQTGSAPNAGTESGGKSKKKLIIIAAALALLAGAGGGAWFFLASNGQHGDKAAEHRPPPPPVFMALETFTVNLQGDDMQQFLQVNLTLQLAGEAQSDLIKTNMPQVRNRLLLLLSSKKAAEILTVEGKKKLAEEIVAAVRQPFAPRGPKPDVTDVFFTSFVVQ